MNLKKEPRATRKTPSDVKYGDTHSELTFRRNMIVGSGNLLNALQREHPEIVATLQKKSEDKGHVA